MLELCQATLHHRIEAVDLRISKGECWHILGTNGAGKSSLLSLLSGVMNPDTGSVLLEQRDVQDWSIIELANKRCLLEQLPQVEFDISLAELLSFYTQYTQLPTVLENALCLRELMHLPLTQLSGGQQQRFHLARSLAQVWKNIEKGQALIILDEPCQHLDVKYQAKLLRLLDTLVADGNTIVMSSHNVNQSQRYATHIAWIKHNKVLSHGPVNTQISLSMLEQTYEHTFTRVHHPQQNQVIYISNNE